MQEATIAFLLATAVTAATGSQSLSSVHIWRGQSDGATSAVLSATGDAIIVRSAGNPRDAGMAFGGEALDECIDHCSEWEDGINDTTINICQHNTDKHKCLPHQPDLQCPTDYSRCRQKAIDKCILTCADFSGGVNKETDIVCMIMDSGDDMGLCKPLPCNAHANTIMCKQTHDVCRNSCAVVGSDPAPPGTPTCFDATSETCHAVEDCEAQGWTRCISSDVHQDLSHDDQHNDNDPDPNWYDPPLALDDTEKSGMEAKQIDGKMMRQHKSVAHVG